jgi:hypothetical protein
MNAENTKARRKAQKKRSKNVFDKTKTGREKKSIVAARHKNFSLHA